jgi:hypothetical protein
MTKKSCRYLVTLIILCLCITPILAETSDNYWSPWVTKTTTDSATINWRGEDNGSGSVDYATSSYFNAHHSFEKTRDTTGAATYQHIQITGLESDTSYIYRVRPSGGDDLFDNRSFRTMPASGPFTFIVISDPQKGHRYDETKRFKYVAEAVAKEPDIQFILVGGDFNGFDSASDWSQFFQVADGMLSKSAIFPTIGNHEYHNPKGESNPPTAADHYNWAFDMPLNYSFDCSKVRFIVLNTPDPNNHGNGDDPKTSLALAESQESWLREQLDNNTLLGAFTVHHHPIWDHGRTTMNPNLEPWENLYHSYNISANFAGHIHNYQRFSIKGIPYFIVGNAGGRCNDITGNIAPVGYMFGIDKTLGYLKVTVDPANNTATAQEWIVATVKHDDSKDEPKVYKNPEMIDSTTFPLKHQPS